MQCTDSKLYIIFSFSLMHPSVDLFIECQAPEKQQLLQRLRSLILSSAPYVEESIKWNIPFYSAGGLLCYLNPQAKGVALGFCRGALLSNTDGLLRGTGKEVRLLLLSSGTSIKEDRIREFLQEALLLNQTLRRNKQYHL